MGKMEIKQFIDLAVGEIAGIELSRPGGLFSRTPVRVKYSDDMVCRMLIEKVWAMCLSLVNLKTGTKGPLEAEKVITALKSRGLVRDKVVYKKDSFRISLEHNDYRIYKTGPDGENMLACPWPSEKRYQVRAPGEAFANFLAKFDAEIPEMVSRVPKIMETLRARELEEDKNKMAQRLKEEFIDTLVNQYLTPLGLVVKFSVGEDDVVSMDVAQSFYTRLNIPLEKLTETVKDTDAILKKLYGG